MTKNTASGKCFSVTNKVNMVGITSKGANALAFFVGND